ncbi:MAG: holdfast anchoring protein HfaB [Phenylobacterium sp.]|uniref:holdfast anchoring protein HfaB n=1 Tax=Phenylobacterium sp. TaxID=1871053 RepID=UPI0025E91843|nr:holdfast anchoring protein HfaB [Phenylobacterium sp.]MCG9917331.1 holdfast anchoring protein HfaB [Phenylobacterium sp.]
MRLVKTWIGMALAGAMAASSVGSAQASDLYAKPFGDAPATRNPTGYTPALLCLATQRPHTPLPRIAVGRISDMTGKVDFSTGARVSQGASLFAITALGKAGFPVVERLDNTVAEIELNYARQQLLSDTPEQAGRVADNYRRIYTGQIAGSSYYIVGGITELNANIASSGVNATVGEREQNGTRGGFSRQTYVINVAIDLRLVNSRTQEVIDMVSYQKQVRGADLQLGLTGGENDTGGVLNGGRSSMEPLQAAVRTLVERGVFELTANFYGGAVKSACLDASSEPQGLPLPKYAAAITRPDALSARPH